MPQKSPFGFVFLSGNLSDSKPLTTDNYRTIAHELGHGLWGLDHTFCKAYAVPQGTTTNLMDYTTKSPTNYLSYFEWSQIDSPVQSWSVFNSDEGNMEFYDYLNTNILWASLPYYAKRITSKWAEKLKNKYTLFYKISNLSKGSFQNTDLERYSHTYTYEEIVSIGNFDNEFCREKLNYFKDLSEIETKRIYESGTPLSPIGSKTVLSEETFRKVASAFYNKNLSRDYVLSFDEFSLLSLSLHDNTYFQNYFINNFVDFFIKI